MKKHGFLKTFSPDKSFINQDGTSLNPLDNYIIQFIGPKGFGIKETIRGTAVMEKELWTLVFTRNEYGWKQLHFEVLDYFLEKYDLELEVETHDYTKQEDGHLYETILVGEWKKK